jgi:hypothetical protein
MPERVFGYLTLTAINLDTGEADSETYSVHGQEWLEGVDRVYVTDEHGVEYLITTSRR